MTNIEVFAQTESDLRISIFKNGSAFFAKKVKFNAENGNAYLAKLPAAAYGLLWFNAESNSLKHVKSLSKTSDKERKVSSLRELIRANAGQRAVVTYLHAGNAVKAEGIIGCENGLLSVKTNDKILFFDEANVADCQFFEMPKFSLKENQNEDVWEFSFAKNNREQTVEMLYLQRGLAWFPAYQIELLTDEKAKITFSTQIMNEAEDIENANIQLVVGVPNFQFEHLKAPLASSENLSSLLSQLSGNSSRYNVSPMRNVMTQQMYAYNENYGDFDAAPDAAGLDFEATGEQAGDLFFYDAPANISLKKGEKIAFDIFKTECHYQHSYDVQLKSSRSDGLFYAEFKPTEAKLPEVWHSIHLKNETKTPWTTAPVFAVSKTGNAKPLSQDKITYTPVGAKAKIKLTVASDISVREEERETDRKQVKLKDGNYEQITVEAKISINNYKKSNVKININKLVFGEMLKSDLNWKVDKMTGYNYANNRNNQVSWEIEVGAEKEKVITYSYMTFVKK